jgi:serine/threonine protein kinase
MSLASGTRLGPYEIVAPLGVGGMGEVYRARDTKLRREVALKFLPELFTADPDRLARFRREAHVLASLNHPHIAGIYGLEEADGVRALVLELVEGPTLAERIAAEPIPVTEALRIASQIADAMEAAHEKGVIHRDLKPANIKVTPDDRVKVLDFGLAKALADETAADPSMSPTMTAMASRLGVIVGTAAYMSPEQAKGKAVDKRTDIWAFGCVLFEMLTGKQAFEGEDVTDFVVAVMTKEPDWTALPPATPPRIVELLHRGLKKDPRDRLRDIGDARLEIEEALRAPNAQQAVSVEAPARGLSWTVVFGVLTAGILVGAAAVGIWHLRRGEQSPSQTSGPLTRTAIDLPSNARLALGTVIPLEGFDSNVIALSPDGRHLAYVGQSPSGTVLYLRDTGGLDVAPIPGTEGAIYPFFSPDSRWLGFLTNDKVKKISLEGGAPVTLCDARVPVRATWLTNDAIYFGEDEGSRLSRVGAAGGSATVVVPTPADRRVTFSQTLPGGKEALATTWARGISADYADVALVSLATGESKVLIHSGYDARYVPPGYVLFGRGGNLLAIRFDPTRGEVAGDPMPVVSGASMESFFGQVHASASDNGLIAYAPGGDRAMGRLVWVDRQGRAELLPAPARLYGVVDLSPNGKRVAVHVADVTDYIWVYDIGRGEGRKLTVNENSGWPIWSPDNMTIAFEAWQVYGRSRVLSRVVDGGPVRELVPLSTIEPFEHTPQSWSPDGRVLGLYSFGRQSGIWFLPLGGTLQHVTNERVNGWGNDFSPDGRWVAHSSTEAGQSEIFVRSYPDGKTIRQISVDGGIEPVWCPCGELFYRNGNRWMSAKIRTQPDLQWDPPQLAFQTDFIDTPGRSYDVSPDGKRLLVVKRAEPDVRNQINLVVNWTAALSR